MYQRQFTEHHGGPIHFGVFLFFLLIYVFIDIIICLFVYFVRLWSEEGPASKRRRVNIIFNTIAVVNDDRSNADRGSSVSAVKCYMTGRCYKGRMEEDIRSTYSAESIYGLKNK